MISSPGIGSGLDVNSIVSALLEIDQVRIVQLEAEKADNQIKISDYGQISGALSQLEANIKVLSDANNYSRFTAISSDLNFFTASAGTGAAAANYNIQVDNLAVAHRLNSAAFTDAMTEVGTGTLAISSGTNSFSVTIDSSNNTVEGIRDAINNASDNDSVTASIINDDAGSRLILTANNTGIANDIAITVTNDGDGNDTDNSGLSQLRYDATKNLTELTDSEDASLRIDGFTVTSASNAVTDAIDGVTINLHGEGTADLNVSSDFVAVNNAVSAMVDSYNNLIAIVNILGDGSLSGTTLLNRLEQQIRDTFGVRFDDLDGDITSVFDLGLSFDKDGVLTLDSSKLNTALLNNPDSVQQLLDREDVGFAESLEDVIATYLGEDGLIQNQIDSIESSNDLLDDRIETMTESLLRTEERLLRQFTELDILMAELSTTSLFLEQQLSVLNFDYNPSDN